MNLRKRLNINHATSFKLDYYEGGSDLKFKIFKSYKAMEQFHVRQTEFMYLDINRYALIDDKWHLFMKLRSPIVFQQDVDFINKTFQVIEVKHLQKIENEEK